MTTIDLVALWTLVDGCPSCDSNYCDDCRRAAIRALPALLAFVSEAVELLVDADDYCDDDRIDWRRKRDALLARVKPAEERTPEDRAADAAAEHRERQNAPCPNHGGNCDC